MTAPTHITTTLDQTEINTILQALAALQMNAQTLQAKLVDAVNNALAPPQPMAPDTPPDSAAPKYPPKRSVE